MKKVFFITILFTLMVNVVLYAQQGPKKAKKRSKAQVVETLKEDGIDPVCKMKVKKGSSLTHTHEGIQYGFCNPMCKENFVKTPDKFLKK